MTRMNTGYMNDEYGVGGIRRHEVDCLLILGAWFLISIDSLILHSAASLQTCRISTVNVLSVICVSVWCCLVCSPKCLPCSFLRALPKCSLKRVLICRVVSPMYVCEQSVQLIL